MALISPDDEQFDFLLHKLKERLDEGHGETIYEVGVGGEQSLHLLIDHDLTLYAWEMP